MKVLLIGEFTSKLIYPFLMAISLLVLYFSREVIRTPVLDTLPDNREVKFTHHPFYLTWLCYISKLFVLIPFFIQRKKLNDTPIKKNTSNSIQVDTLNEQTITQESRRGETGSEIDRIKELPTKGKVKLFFLFFALHLCESSAITAGLAIKEIELPFLDLIIRGCLIYFTTFFSFIILKTKYARHHFLGIILISIGMLIYTIVEYTTLKANNELSKYAQNNGWIFYLIFITFVQICSALQECIEKYMMENKYFSPYFIISCEAVMGFVIETGILITVSTVAYCYADNYYCFMNPKLDYKSENFMNTTKIIFSNPIMLFCILGSLVSYTFYDIFRIKTNQEYSPTHRSIGDTLGSFFFWIVLVIMKCFNWFDFEFIGSAAFSLIYLVSYLIILIGVYVFLEIILLHFCSLDRNTKYMIKKRAEIENQYLLSEQEDKKILYSQKNQKIFR